MACTIRLDCCILRTRLNWVAPWQRGSGCLNLLVQLRLDAAIAALFDLETLVRPSFTSVAYGFGRVVWIYGYLICKAFLPTVDLTKN